MFSFKVPQETYSIFTFVNDITRSVPISDVSLLAEQSATQVVNDSFGPNL